MKKHVIPAVLTAVALIISFAASAAFAEAANNSVSGYVSLTEGVKIAGDDTKPVIQYDKDCDQGVIRAAGDLAEDLEAVTGDKPYMQSSDPITHRIGMPAGIHISEDKMEVVLASPLYDPEDKYKCYIAVYNTDASLSAVVESDGGEHTAGVPEGGIFTYQFSKVLQEPEGGQMKAFVWNENMEPYGPAYDMYQAEQLIIVGTLGAGGLIDEYSETNENIKALEGKIESFTIQNIDGTIVIAGSDKRGTIYGIYDLSEKIGVSPWKFWADVEPEKAEELYINLPENGYTEGEPSVKYRGIFLNDEYNMNQWTNSEFPTGMNLAKYEKYYELILRLKMNFMWPAMHKYSTSFHNIEGAAAKADEYGVVVGSSHAEPLLRNNLGELVNFYNEWKEKDENKNKPLYTIYDSYDLKANVPYAWTHYAQYENGVGVEGTEVYNCEFLEDYWRSCVQENGAYDNVYTLGMRGVHDGSFSTNMDNETALKELIAKQIEILNEELVGEGKKYSRIEDVPMVYIPYKDVLTYYNKDDRLNLPEYVTIMWTDDNFGYMRQNSNDAERAYSGRGGVYYHISYYGNPTSYLWLSSTQPGLMREQLTRSYDMGSDRIWLMNVGDLKPAEKEIEYYARLSRDVEGMNNTDISDVYKEMAKRDFNMNDNDAAEYADIMDTYYELANSKRPEFYRNNDAANKLNISVTAYGDEAERYINRYKDITERAEALYDKLPENKKPSFFELALYPIRSAKNMAVDFVQADHAAAYKTQGSYKTANSLAAEANAAADQIDADIKYYNEMLNGKWNKMTNMNPSELQGCDAHLTTDFAPSAVTELDYTDMTVSETELSLSKYDSYAKYFDISNTGYGSFDYEITTDSNAIKLSKANGTVYSSERIYVTLDASKAASTSGTITVSQKLGENTVKTETIEVSISNPADVTAEKTYVETDGTVSVEAEHYTSLTDKGDYKWQIEKDFGRSGDSLKIYPNLSADVNNTASDMIANSAVASYDIYFENTGKYNVNIYRMPTLNARGNCRVGIGLDDGDPTPIGGTNNSPTSTNDSKVKTNPWPKQVLKNCEILTTTVTVNEAGKHTLKLYNVSSGMVIDKIVLVKDEAPYSFFGAPESYNTTYNNEIAVPETTAGTEADDSGITKTFEPKAVIGVTTRAENKITVPVYAIDSISNAVVMVAAYGDNGEMSSVDFEKITFTGGKAQAELDLPDTAQNYIITVVDSLTDMHVIAPYKKYGTIVSKISSGGFSVTENMSKYSGKKSVVLVADTAITEDITAEHIKYMYAEAAAEKLFKNLPFTAEGGSKYYIRIGIDGENHVDEQFEAAAVSYTIVRELKSGSGSATTDLERGSSYSGSTVSAENLPIVIKDNGKYYVLSENSDEDYTREWTLSDAAEQTLKVTYTLDENIVSYVEFEDFGKNVIENSAYSNGKAGRLSDNTIIKLIDNPAAGNYELTASVVNDKGNGFKLKYGDNKDVDGTQWAPNLGLFSAAFTLSDSGDLTKLQLSKNGTYSPTFDYIIIRKVPDNVNYSVKAVAPDGTELADITPVEATSIKAAGLPEVIEKDGKYYRVSDSMVGKNTHSKRITQTLTAGGTVNVEYTLDESIVYYAEVEDFGDSNKTVKENSSCSNGKSAYLDYRYFAHLSNNEFPAGKYEFEGYVTGRGTAVGLRFKKTEADSSNFITIACPLFDTDKSDTFTYQFELAEPTTLIMAGLSNTGGSAGTPEFDYILIKSLDE